MTPSDLAYTDLLIRIRRQSGGQDYPVEAWINEAAHYAGGLLHVDWQLLRQQEAEPQAYGTTLFYALLSGPIRAAYDKATGIAEAATFGRLRLRLWIDVESAELHSIAWERMHSLRAAEASPLAVAPDLAFSRHLRRQVLEPDPVAVDTVRMLFVVANPSGLERDGLMPIGVDEEVHALWQATRTLREGGRLQVEVFPGRGGYSGPSPEAGGDVKDVGWVVREGATTLERVLAALNEAGGYHILHLLAHGRFGGPDQTPILLLEGADGGLRLVRGPEFAAGVGALSEQPALVFLAACDSARRDVSRGNAFVGLAPSLVADGVAAVVAMQDGISMTVARALNGAFYRGLLEHGLADRALSQARLLVYQDHAVDWSVPMLVSSRRDVRLFRGDPLRTLLRNLSASPDLNPLPTDAAYIPLEVVLQTGRQAADSGRSVPGFAVDLPDGDHSMLRAASRDAIDAVDDLMGSPVRGVVTERRVVVLRSGAGMGKSYLLRRIGRLAALDSLESGALACIVPVLLDFSTLGAQVEAPADLERLVFAHLRAFWPEAATDQLRTLWHSEQGPVFRLLLDGVEALPQRARRSLIVAVNALTRAFPRHQCVIAWQGRSEDLNDLAFTDAFDILPLSQATISWYLSRQGHVGSRLYQALVDAEALDLAAQPWLLDRLLGLAHRGLYPESRLSVVDGLLAGDVEAISDDPGMRARVMETLDALAWALHSTQRRALPTDEVFATMQATRGGRDYGLEALYRELTDRAILIPTGDDHVSFARAAIQAFCCARALAHHTQQAQELDDICATLRRRTRLYWWQDALLFLCSMAPRPEEIVRRVLYGAEPGDDEVLLGARMVQQLGVEHVDPILVDHIARALIYQLDSVREPRVWRRAEHVAALGRICHPDAIAGLASIVLQPVQAVDGRQDFEASDVRLAALEALGHLVEPPFDELTDPDLVDVLTEWFANDVMALVQRVVDLDAPSAAASGVQAVAALALAALQTLTAFDVLAQLFFYPDSRPETRQNLTTALTLIDAGMVVHRVILPILDPDICKSTDLGSAVCEDVRAWYPHVIYLAGRVRAHDDRVVAFLRRCLFGEDDVNLVGLAVQSLGWLGDASSREAAEDLALGDLARFSLPATVEASDLLYLQRQALEALRFVGDMGTLERLRQRPGSWPPDMDRVFYWTSEEIIWREERRAGD